MENQVTQKIHESLVAIMGEIDPIKKNKENKSQGYKFRGVEDVYAVLNPMLVANKVIMIPECLEHQIDTFLSKSGGTLFRAVVKMRYKLISAVDGSSIECVMMGEGMDSGDKATPKAISIAFKYLAFQLFCIPVDDAIDPDHETHAVAPAMQPNQQATQTAVQAKSEPTAWLNSCDKQGNPTREWNALTVAIEEGRIISVQQVRESFKVSKAVQSEIESLLTLNER
jgi:hypothetical protein